MNLVSLVKFSVVASEKINKEEREMIIADQKIREKE